ncbi:MAG: S8 family peptidase [Blastocatellia bacterium]
MAKSTKSAKKKPARKKVESKTPRLRKAATSRARTPPASTGALRLAKPRPVSVRSLRAKSDTSFTVAAGAEPEVQTIVYIHGIGNKPPAATLKCQWDHALFGVQLGDRSRMAYWVNRDYYPTPSNDTCATGDLVQIDDDEASTRAIMALAAGKPTDERTAIENEIKSLTDDSARRNWLRKLSEKMTSVALADESAVRERHLKATGVSAKLIPLPAFLRRLITQKLTRAFLRDVNDFFFHPDRQEAMQQSLVERLNAGGGPFILIAHSQGTMIAYNVLRQISKNDCDVRLFVTIGSPLGLTEVKDVFRTWVPGGKLRKPDCVTRWVNVAEWLDPVAADHDISNDFAGPIENFDGFLLNPDSPRHPHSGTGYLRSEPVRRVVNDVAGNAFGQAVGKVVITKDLTEDLENGFRGERHTALIQLKTPGKPGPLGQETLSDVRKKLTETITELVAESGDTPDAAGIDPLKRFVSAKLTRLEIEKLRTRYKDLQIERVWRDATKRALINQSTHTIQARPANLGYGALGRDIGWAVLDTGIRADHPHFKEFNNIADQWDCTKRGKPVQATKKESDALDKNGHGTHVAGVIAGRFELPEERKGPDILFSGIAPETKLYGFKVLDDQGIGQDSYILKALDHIADLNDEAGKLVIQGVNLSLGGAFDPSVYGCGHTPLCQELRRLWGQGVLVCLAAGNEGYALLQAAEGEVPANMDLSIGDPANLDEAIAVGSIHKSNPHTFGVSYFSSRGPTADGRRKPDLVAPGERILSAYHKFSRRNPEGQRTVSDLYVEMSGTSMACPHVSGLLAAFLSVRREFIGYPNRVKTILLENCTDLSRDVYIQGRGMPNLIKMLANS